jgi:hypothetical protein
VVSKISTCSIVVSKVVGKKQEPPQRAVSGRTS